MPQSPGAVLPWGMMGPVEEPPPPPSSRPSLAGTLQGKQHSVQARTAEQRRKDDQWPALHTPLLESWSGVGPWQGRGQRVMLGGGRAGGQGPGDPSSTSQLPWFLMSVPLTLCSTFSVAHTCPHNIRSPDKYVPMSPAGHPLCSLNTQGTRGEGGGRQQIPLVQAPGSDFGPGSRIYKGQLLDSGMQTPALEIASFCNDKAQCPGASPVTLKLVPFQPH